MKKKEDIIYEAIINGDTISTIDPVIKVVIHNNTYGYEYFPEDIKALEIRIKE